MVVVAVASLPAGLSTVSTLREVGGEVALLVAGAAAGGSSSFGESSGDREEEYGVPTSFQTVCKNNFTDGSMKNRLVHQIYSMSVSCESFR